MKGERVAQLELILRSHPEGLRKSEIARRIGVHRSTVGRYIDELKNYSDVYEENNLVKISAKDNDEQLALSIYESIALNMGAEMLLKNAEYQNPHLASGLRKIAMNMQSYAPKISKDIIQMAEEIENKAKNEEMTFQYSSILDVLIDAWVSGKIVRIIHTPNASGSEEEVEMAPYFIGFVENGDQRQPMTVTGRLRHTAETVTLDISKIKSVVILNETYTIPDNMKVFRRVEEKSAIEQVIDTIPLVLKIKDKSALNSFRSLAHGEATIEKLEDGTYKCSFDAENSIELFLRIIQGFDDIEILQPQSYRDKFVRNLKKVLSIYEG
ncbi:MAG: WYL domain-containing protein [Sphaerochaetaceae bacterium]|nr:WYL domain-containing protein [Sphaerochaetaceae bacterium]